MPRTSNVSRICACGAPKRSGPVRCDACAAVHTRQVSAVRRARRTAAEALSARTTADVDRAALARERAERRPWCRHYAACCGTMARAKGSGWGGVGWSWSCGGCLVRDLEAPPPVAGHCCNGLEEHPVPRSHGRRL
jgi:hypothetical protein